MNSLLSPLVHSTFAVENQLIFFYEYEISNLPMCGLEGDDPRHTLPTTRVKNWRALHARRRQLHLLRSATHPRTSQPSPMERQDAQHLAEARWLVERQLQAHPFGRSFQHQPAGCTDPFRPSASPKRPAPLAFSLSPLNFKLSTIN